MPTPGGSPPSRAPGVATSTGRVARVARSIPIILFGRPWRGSERYAPFFIVGSGRCGSTLLRAMLEAHPAVHIPPENPLGAILRDYRRYGRLPWNVVLRVVLARLAFHPTWDRWELSIAEPFRALDALPPSSRNLAAILNALYRAHTARHKPGAPRWGDKTPPNTFFLPELVRVFPDLRAIHLIRDGRDVVHSFMQTPRHPLAWCAERWLGAVHAAQAFGAGRPAQYLEIRYEDLVSTPESTLRRVAAFLGFEFDERMLRHHELGLKLGDAERYPKLQGVWRPVHTEAVGRWRTALDAEQQRELDRRLGPTLRALGYDADSRVSR